MPRVPVQQQPGLGLLPVNIRILCPGLLGPPDPPTGQLPPTPALDRLLARADCLESSQRDPLETLAAAFGLTVSPDRDLPSAALCLLAQVPELARVGCWVHADPVYLRPDRDRLLLFSGPSLGVREDEARALIAAFNAHFGSDGLELAGPSPDRWYLRVPGAPELRTSPLHLVHGRSVDPYLPTGADSRVWARWQNEAQMLFFQHPVNQARAAVGRPAISGVWTWGAGVLPSVTGGPALTVADHPLAVGLVRAGGGRIQCLDALAGRNGSWPWIGDENGAESILLFWDRLWQPAIEGDWDAWRRSLSELETLAAGLWLDLRAGRLSALRIDDGSGLRCALVRLALGRFWRRRGGLRERMVRLAGPRRPRTRCGPSRLSVNADGAPAA